MRSLPGLVSVMYVLVGPPPPLTEVAIPRPWTDEAMATFELPLATPEFSPRHVPESYYYALPVRPIYRSYPVYHPDFEPPGCLEELRAKDPEVVFEAESESLDSEADWIAAGRSSSMLP